jgi:hypothetical protein
VSRPGANVIDTLTPRFRKASAYSCGNFGSELSSRLAAADGAGHPQARPKQLITEGTDLAGQCTPEGRGGISTGEDPPVVDFLAVYVYSTPPSLPRR